jgi:aminoglycoside phosphotransferase (APT) family kinase protein
LAVETGWLRRFPQHPLSTRQIEQLLRPFASGARVEEATLLAGGLRNTNYRLRLSSQAEPVVLRVFSATDELGGAAGREAAIIRLIEARIPVPRVLHSAPDADPQWNLMSFVEGERFDLFLEHASVDRIAAASHDAGRVLAAIHSFAFRGPGWFGHDLSLGPTPWPNISWSQMLSGWLTDGATGSHLQPRLRDRLLAFIAHHADRVEPLNGSSRLVHADFKPWNLLVADHRVVAVLDWEMAYSGNPMTDLGIYLRYSDRLPPAYREGFAAGYRDAGGELPADWFGLARLTDLTNLLYFLEFRGSDPAVLRDVIPLIETTLTDFAP